MELLTSIQPSYKQLKNTYQNSTQFPVIYLNIFENMSKHHMNTKTKDMLISKTFHKQPQFSTINHIDTYNQESNKQSQQTTKLASLTTQDTHTPLCP